MPWTPKARVFWPLAATVLLADCASKRIVETALTPAHIPHPLLGDVVRLTLTYNPGAAMSLSLGPYSRLGFSLLAVAGLAVLARVYRRLPRGAELAAVGLALVAGGALGNALDRLRSARGVVDFIDVGLGATRFWTFNVADMAITAGAIALAVALSRPTPTNEAAGPPRRAA
jgi:signal peptidase II